METKIDNNNNQQPVRKGNIVLRGLSKIQKDTLLKTEIGLAGIAIGAGAFALMGFISKSNNKIVKPTGPTPVSNNSEVFDDAVVICTEAPFAKSVTDDMDFEKAYATAREEVGPGGFFEYEGKLYNTYTKEEWSNMTAEQHQEYWKSIDEETTQIQEVNSSVTIPMNSPIDEEDDENSQTGESNIIDEADHDFEQKIIKEMDSNHDGKSDIFLVDANGNEIHDLVLDTNFDGDADIILMDVNVVGNEIQFGAAYTMTGEVLPIGGPISIGQGADDEGYEVKDDQDQDEDDQEDTEADELDENDLQGNLNDEADNNISNDDSMDGFYS